MSKIIIMFNKRIINLTYKKTVNKIIMELITGFRIDEHSYKSIYDHKIMQYIRYLFTFIFKSFYL
jgi:hypothetical protein